LPDAAEEGRLRWTSVPRWPAPVLPAAASYLACWFGGEGERKGRQLLAGADPDVPVHTAAFAARWDPAAEARLRRLIGDCFTGVRIILAGPEATVLCAAALASQLGAASEELVLLAAGEGARRVFCATCRASFDVVAALDDLVTCPGCAARLTVDHRFSRPHAAYFGWPAGLDLYR
jgi:dimethylamine monooxygenase subunit C